MSGWMVLLGGNPLNAGIAAYAASRGLRCIVVDWNEIPEVPGDLHIRMDIKDSRGVLEALSPYMKEILLAYTSADVATGTVAEVHRALGYVTPSDASLLLARNKVEMNERWERDGLLGKRFRKCFTLDDLKGFLDTEPSTAVVVKPALASSSRGVTVLPSRPGRSEVDRAFERASKHDPAGIVLVEDFVEGTEFTVEMLGDSLGNVRVFGVSKKYHTHYAGTNRVATKLHYNPNDVTQNVKEELATFGSRCYTSLGLCACPGHFEVIRRLDGTLVPVEMAARSSGFIISDLVDASLDRKGAFIDALRSVLDGSALKPGLEPASNSSMYFFYDLPPGVWLGDAQGLLPFLPTGVRTLASDRKRLIAGSKFSSIDSDTERVGFEILAGPTSALTIDSIFTAERGMLGDGMVSKEQFDPIKAVRMLRGSEINLSTSAWETLERSAKLDFDEFAQIVCQGITA